MLNPTPIPTLALCASPTLTLIWARACVLATWRQTGLESFALEVELLARQRHPYVLRLFGACIAPPEHCWVVTELLTRGTLTEFLYGSKGRKWTRRPSNVFVSAEHHVRVADFGFARFLTASDEALTGETGTYMYMAPEVIRHERYTEKCDVYSYGVMLNELLSGEPPYIDGFLTPLQ
eukprot:jgi/Mesen1/3015/ME000177S02293